MGIFSNSDAKCAVEFLEAYSEAQDAMKRATTLMLRCSTEAKNRTSQRRYDREHKRMKRILREWNRVEHYREDDTWTTFSRLVTEIWDDQRVHGEILIDLNERLQSCLAENESLKLQIARNE